MNELNNFIDPTAINQELSFNSNIFEINKEETKNDLNSELYGLNERSKNEKLSLDQRGLLNEMLRLIDFLWENFYSDLIFHTLCSIK